MEKIKKMISDMSKGNYSEREITMSAALVFLCGIVLGSCFASKKQTMIGCFNGNTVERK